jgi:dihydroneopterin aldolase/2-amino-4-hydroxy-6-hydroxymethyldihydropteridine diphosphokinase
MTHDRFADRLSLGGMRFIGRHGANEGEQDSPQPFEVDVMLHADLAGAGDRDELSATVDYRTLAEIARDVVEGPAVVLIEALAGRIAEGILAATPASLVGAVEVWVRKPEAALEVEFETVEVSVLRRRGADGGDQSAGSSPSVT